MEPPRSLKLLRKRCLRSGITLKIGWLFLLIVSGGCLVCAETRPWALAGFIMAVVFSLALTRLRQKLGALSDVLSLSQIIYWSQNRPANELTRKVLAGRAPLRLHLNNGEHLDVDVFANEMDYFSRWIKERNPHVRWGTSYEK